ncbi:unnamed protein product [Spirodela intermedia]|uniref:LysM domain-containing protein n=1 Tax=Spirodela intermedia TaxID=51605 RepID=A0A7I8JVR7_SPIIN|nr:unnamed protein product [Spirodela intermedia]CAA6673552.1 unnamed protein product [Spirodela intermedia]
MVLPLPLLFLFLLVSACVAQPPPKFRCSSKSNCQALAGYVPPREMTYEAVRGLFDIPANTTVRIPFTCTCGNGTGVSERRPFYAVKNGDSLLAIAREIFGGLVTYQQIAAANGIANASLINAGQRLFIPLPCSCDDVDIHTIHLAHVVKQGSTLAEVSREFGSSEASLISRNSISDPKSLLPGQVLDVPLTGCSSSSIHRDSPDYGLLVPNGSYALTAGNCIRLWCAKTPDSLLNTTLRCNQPLCNSNESPDHQLEIQIPYISACMVTWCFYAGFDNGKILTTTTSSSTCGELHDSGPLMAVALVSL